MKILKKLLIIFLIFLIILITASSIYFRKYGKDIIQNAFETSLKREVVLENVYYAFPFQLRAKNVRIDHAEKGRKFFEAGYISAKLSIDAIVQRQFIFDTVTLIKPLVVIEKFRKTESDETPPDRRHGVVVPPDSSELPKEDGRDEVNKDGGAGSFTRIIIRNLIIKEGRFTYSNRSIDKDFSFAMEDVFLNAEQLSFPVKPDKTDFNISGHLIREKNPLSGSAFRGSGWVDIVSRNMEANVEILEANGSVGMSAKVVSQDNNMDVRGEFNFKDMFAEMIKTDPSDGSATSDLIMNALSSAGVNIGAKFSFQTKMDDFRPEKVSFSGNVLTK